MTLATLTPTGLIWREDEKEAIAAFESANPGYRIIHTPPGKSAILDGVIVKSDEVAGVVVVAAEDAQYGCVPVIAFVGAASESSVEEVARQSLNGLSIPLRIRKLESLPMLANGKPDRLRIGQL